MSTAILVHKLSAGSHDHSRDELEAVLREKGYQPRYVPVESGETADLGEGAADLVVVAGGDGTLASLLPQLRRLGVPVALVPLGTANNVARSLGIGEPFTALAPDATFGPFDLGLCTIDGEERPFSEAAGIGAMAGVLRCESEGASGEEKLERGRRSLADLLSEAEPFHLRIDADGEAIDGHFLAVEILNTRTVGPSLTLAPEADPGDGLLDICCLGASDRDAFLAWLRSDRRGVAPGLRSRAARVRFDWDGRVDFRIDDCLVEPSSGTRRVGIGVAERPLQMRLPPRQP